ncbi:hypothetical protein D3C76_1305540 [compost metagenome]
MFKKLMLSTFSLVLLFVLSIPVNASPNELTYNDLSTEQKVTYKEYSAKGYDISISRNEDGVVVISGSKRLNNGGISIQAEVETVTYEVNQSVYLGNYKVATIEGSLTAKITNYSSATITSYPLTLKPYGVYLGCTFTQPTYSNTIGSGYAKLVQSFSGTVQSPSGGAMTGTTFPVKMNYTVTASTGNISITQS